MLGRLRKQLVARRRALVARTEQRVLTAYARWRHRGVFDQVERFVVFAGYPRSGHSLVGAFLDAHPDAVIAHELNVARPVLEGVDRDGIYARIIARALSFRRRGNKSNYDYHIPGGWQGRFRTLRVVGDKRGGAFIRALARRPELLDRLRSLVGVPLRVIHVVRNPWDNIAAISIWSQISVAEAIEVYFDHCRTTATLEAVCQPGELLVVRHEDVVAAPRPAIARLLEHCGLSVEPDHLERCAGIVFARPTRTRTKVVWPDGAVAQVARRAAELPFLAGYTFS